MQAGGFGVAWNPFAYWVPVCPEKGVYGYPRGSEGSFKGIFDSGRQIWSTLGLLDSPFSFRQYTTDVFEHVLFFVGCLLGPPVS